MFKGFLDTASEVALVAAIVLSIFYSHTPGVPWIAIGLIFLFLSLGPLRWVHQWLASKLRAQHRFFWFKYERDERCIDDLFPLLRVLCLFAGIALIVIGVLANILAAVSEF